MPLKSSLRWSLYDRALALGPFLLGLLIALAGLWLGAGAFLDELLFGDISDAGSPASMPLVVGGVVLGGIVWQIGRSAARHHAMRTAIDERIHEVVDEEHIASAAATKVDDRIADVENDVQQVSRKTTRLEQEMRGDELTEEGLDPSPSSIAGADSAEPAAAGTDTGVGDSGFDGVEPTSAGDTGSDSDDAATAGDEFGTAGADDSDPSATGSPEPGQDSATEADDATESDEETDDAEGDEDADGTDDADGSDDGFEWEDDTDDGEYYRNS